MRSRQRIVTTSSKAADAVRAADAAWLKVFAARDLDGSVGFFDEHGSMLVPHAPIATGRNAITKLIARGFAFQNYKLVWHPDRAGAARSGELAYTSGKYEVSFKDASGKTLSDKGKYLILWKRQTDGTWKVLFDMSNSDLPPS